uniref:Uncharacterized protein n=1 Tax=Anguilla anguilla TaxID=7936 RepID=A0A0E9T7Q4_ANGAN
MSWAVTLTCTSTARQSLPSSEKAKL